MPNPFEATFNSHCIECGNDIFNGDKVFADRGKFICEFCAEDLNVICECGNYKKPDFETCYKCYKKNNE
jgi:hypothetical protein